MCSGLIRPEQGTRMIRTSGAYCIRLTPARAAPGVEAKPIKQVSGAAHFNEVFFDNFPSSYELIAYGTIVRSLWGRVTFFGKAKWPAVAEHRVFLLKAEPGVEFLASEIYRPAQPRPLV